MKFTNRINLSILFLLTISFHTTFSDDSSDTNTLPQSEIVENSEVCDTKVRNTKESIDADQFEQLLQGVLGQIKQFGSILQSLADQISNNQVKLKNKQNILEHIMLIKQQMNELELQAGSLVDKNLTKITTILSIIDFFTEHMQTMIQNKLLAIPELQTETLIRRTAVSNCDIESVIKVYKINQKSLVKLETNVNHVGLSLRHRVFRALENFNDDHHIISRFLKISLCSLALSTILLLLDKELIGKIPGYNEFISPLKDVVGPAPHWDHKNRLKNGDKLSILGRILSNFGPNSLNLITYVFTPIITWELFINYVRNDAFKAKTLTEDAWVKTLNWFRGGAARKVMRGGKKEPSVMFKDGIGFKHIKYTLSPYIEYYCRTEEWDRANIAPQTGIIFAGEARTGKTFMAEMMAGQIKQEMRARGIKQELTFIVFNAAEVLLLGIGSILEYARSQAPCIIFIDEIDMLGLQRETHAKELSEFLTEMSGCMEKDINKRVILIGATNKPQSLDDALMQYGRFGKVIWFEFPTMHERMLFLTRECNSRAIPIDPNFLEKLARETERCSYDALHSIIATSAQKAKMNGSAVKQYHIQMAFDEEIRQILVKNTQLPKHQQHLISLHLAGHALATHLLDGQKNLVKVTIRPVKVRIQEEPLWARFEKKKEKLNPIIYGKVFTYNKDQELAMPSREDMIKECKIMLAGHAAEKVVLGSSGCGYHRDDNKKALSIAQYIIFKGIDPKELPKSIRCTLEEKAYNLMKKCKKEVTELFSKEKEHLLIITEALEKQQTLTGEEVTMLARLTFDEIKLLQEEIKKLEEQLHAEIQNTTPNLANTENDQSLMDNKKQLIQAPVAAAA